MDGHLKKKESPISDLGFAFQTQNQKFTMKSFYVIIHN